ncbi:MAG: hypothetical protein AAF789_07505 [Bacteroidota bacterium]
MKIPLKFSVFYLCIFLYTTSIAQNDQIEDRFDRLAVEWLQLSGKLKTYSGMSAYCDNPVFRQQVDSILNLFHGYDSTILQLVTNKNEYIIWSEREEKKLLKDIDEMESRFSINLFIDHMKKTCSFWRDIEGNAENLRNGVGIESYDSKMLLLETELRKYLHKIDKLVLKIDDHLHVLHIDY